jgi:transcriptional regulator with GAF, ATPase, and Fis domain
VRGLAAVAELLALTLPAGERAAPRPLRDVERDAIERALVQTGGRVSGPRGAARMLGLKPTTLQSRMKKLGVRRPPRS